MKINGSNQVGAVNQYKKNQEAASAASQSKKAKAKDHVVISAEAKELLGTMDAGKAQRAKVDELKHAVQSGTYSVDAKLLAEKLLPFLK